VLKGWVAAFGFSELTAQLLPFLFGIAAAPFLYSVVRWRGVCRLAGAAGAFVLLTSSIHITYSARVKQYTLDAICVLVLLAVLWWLLEDVRDRRRWWWLALTAVGAIALSSPAAAVAGCGVAVALVARLRDDRHGLRDALGPVALVGLFSGAWWWFVLRPRVNSTLREGFQAQFLGVDEGLGQAARDLARAAATVSRGAVELPGWTEVFVVLAAAVIVLSRQTRVGFLLLTPFALAAVLAALAAAPLGTGRTDIYLYPLLAALVAVAVHETLKLARRLTTLTVLGLGVASLVGFSPANYPQEVVRPLVDEVEASAASRDAVLVYPKTRYPFALYTTWPVNLVESSRFQTGFTVRVRRRNVFVLESTRAGPARKTIESLSRRYGSVWLLVSHGRLPKRIGMLLAEHGYAATSIHREPGASLARWSRR
jgi:4-amino-4-deoxy-L-arabinose transferase-like glycosyltransferase